LYLHTENELFGLRLSEVTALQVDRHTNRCERKHYHAAFAGGSYYPTV